MRNHCLLNWVGSGKVVIGVGILDTFSLQTTVLYGLYGRMYLCVRNRAREN